jgi:hypothetical protein
MAVAGMTAQNWRVFPGGEGNFHNPPLGIFGVRQQIEAARVLEASRSLQTFQLLWSNQHTTSVTQVTH